MKNRFIFSFLAALLIIGIAVNSCKKNSDTPIQSLFTTGTWQLASVMVYHFVGATQLTTDTLNTTCDTTQLFTFPTNNTCTFTNYHCVNQPTAAGTWSLSRDQLYLMVNIACKDTLSGDSSFTTAHPFSYTQIFNIGQYSMILRTGDIGAYFTATQKRTIYQYGFVRQSIKK